MDLLTAKVHALPGLDVIDSKSLTPCIRTNTLMERVIRDMKPVDLRNIKFFRAESYHLSAPLRLPKITRFIKVQLSKLHSQFFHPSTEMLSNLIKTVGPEHATPETRRALEAVLAKCESCQRFQTAPLCFRVSFGAGNLRFNERILIDIMYLVGDPILHIVDEGTHFSTARFVPNIQAVIL